MDEDFQEFNTKLWLGGMPVEFIKWSRHGLIYVRVGSQETVANLSRNTVRRLLKDGTLQIEGFRPAWTYEDSDTPMQ